MLQNILLFILPFLISVTLGGYMLPRMRLAVVPKENYESSVLGVKTNRKKVQIGGVAMFPLLLVVVCVTLAIPRLLGVEGLAHDVEAAVMRIMQVMAGLAILYIVGMKDDLHGTSTGNLFVGLVLTAVMLPATGLWISDLHGFLGIYELSQWAGMTLTVLLSMYITEMFKLLDGIDGLESGISSVALVMFVLFSSVNGFAIGGIIASATLGLVLPYWMMKIWDRGSKKTVMGSSGSYMVGYVIACLTISLSRLEGGRLPEGMLIICLSVIMLPALDIIRVLFSRVNDSRLLLAADKNQINHKLLRTGLGRTGVVMVLLLLVLIFVGVTYSLVYRQTNLNIVVAVDIALYALMHYVINYFIRKAANRSYLRNWNRVYGEEACYLDSDEGKEGSTVVDGMNWLERETKRLCDLFISIGCMVLFSPLFLVIYLLIKAEDGGPAIFRQERIGRFGHKFDILKFRSMRLDAEDEGPALYAGDDDPRLTKVGKFIRAHHLDELPQLWNVFKGEMSLIGYRPERKYYIDQIMENDPRYAFLYQIRPGITSYATLYNGYTDTMEKMLRRLELDLYYLGHRSWWLDMKVLMLTFLSIVSGKKF